MRSAALADAKQKLEPLVKARLKERNAAAAANLAALGVEDPVERRELEERQRGELAGVDGADIDVGADAPEPEPTADIDIAADAADDEAAPETDFI